MWDSMNPFLHLLIVFATFVLIGTVVSAIEKVVRWLWNKR